MFLFHGRKNLKDYRKNIKVNSEQMRVQGKNDFSNFRAKNLRAFSHNKF